MEHRDIIVIGASAGGVATLSTLVGKLPENIAASLFIVVHISPNTFSLLPKILTRAGNIPATHPQDGEKIRPRHIYVAPPNHHLLVEKGHVLIKYGPKENRFRPSIDALFRSAAYFYGPRVIGIVMTGSMDDGSSGLWTIKRLGGVAIVQNPEEAQFSEMPLNALKQVEVDHIAKVAEMPDLLERLIREQVNSLPALPALEKKRLEIELNFASGKNTTEADMTSLGKFCEFSCPECHGSLIEIDEGKSLIRYRCHTGHAYSPSSLLASIKEANETLIWQTLRGLKENAFLLEKAAKHFAAQNHPDAGRFILKAQQSMKNAWDIHDFLMQILSTNETLKSSQPQ